MFRTRRIRHFGFAATFVLVAIVPGLKTQPSDPGTLPAALPVFAGGVFAAQQSAPAAQVPAIPVEIVALERDGKPADGLTPESFSVTVDGKPRRVMWVRHVSRGPGASGEAARRLPDRTDTLSFAAEPARNVLVVIDEHSIERGDERLVRQAASALVDRLGLDDRVAVLRIPVARNTRLALTTERPDVREALRQIIGHARDAAASPSNAPPAVQQAAAADPNRVTTDPDRAVTEERERTPADISSPARADDEAAAWQRGFLPNLQSVLTALRGARSRKIVAIFSAGFPQGPASRVDDVARAAVAGHATIYAVGLPGALNDAANPLDAGALERLARTTGGTFTLAGKNADRSLERVMPELSACYVLGVEPGPTDTEGSRHTLRVEVPRKALAIRAPEWLIPRQDVVDQFPTVDAAPGGRGAASPAVEAGRLSATPVNAVRVKPAAPSLRELELQRLVARAADYVAGYQREYSMLVAEEEYYQASKTQRQLLRSDLLLIRPQLGDSWVSFRDVFEVNGQAVRDRDDRLKRLFLDPGTEAQAQLDLIMSDSARYNIGPVTRNINVPLFAMTFLERANLWRSRFKISGTHEVGGVASTRIDYQETGRPTLVRHNKTEDIDARGWFLIDPASGALTGSRMQFTFADSSTFEFVVKYGRDEKLGMWVPVEMTEVLTRTPGSPGSTVTLDARATYTKFRRFQVKAETEIRLVK